MKVQKGSALAGALAFSMILTFAASGFLMMAGNAGNDSDFGARDAALHNAAESGLLTGARWYESHATGTLDGLGDSTVLTWTAATAPQNGYETISDILVRVTLYSAPGPGRDTLVAVATRGPGRDVLKIKWDVSNDLNLPGGSPLLALTCPTNGEACPISSTATFSNWRETIIPGTGP